MAGSAAAGFIGSQAPGLFVGAAVTSLIVTAVALVLIWRRRPAGPEATAAQPAGPSWPPAAPPLDEVAGPAGPGGEAMPPAPDRMELTAVARAAPAAPQLLAETGPEPSLQMAPAGPGTAELPWPDWLTPGAEPARPGAQALTPVAARPSHPRSGPRERYEVLLGTDRIRLVLSEIIPGPALATPPAPDRGPEPPSRHLAWAPLPGAVPSGGIAFACVGAADGGCLFLDLGRAPGQITVTGDPYAVRKLTESVAHQLGARQARRRCAVVVVGGAVPGPQPPGTTWLASLNQLPEVLAAPAAAVVILFCACRSDDDALALEDGLARAQAQVVPVVVDGRLDAPWVLMAEPSPDLPGTTS